MKRLSIAALLLVSLLLSPDSARGEEKAPQFNCTLTSTTTAIVEGRSPNLQVTIRNDNGKDATLVGRLDGSGLGSSRYPRCGFEVFDTEGKPVKLKTLAGCGNQTPLRAGDFVTVAAGSDFNPFDTTKGFFRSPDLTRMAFLPPGTYQIRFVYQTSSGSIVDYIGDDRINGASGASPELTKLHSAIPVVDLKSNEITLTITPRKKDHGK